MILLSVLFTLFSVYRVTNSVGLHGFHFRGIERLDSYGLNKSEPVVEGWITQPLDHFNHRDNRNWKMRYLENGGHFVEGGAVFIMLGGEWEIEPSYLETGLMYEIASTHRGMMYYTEHRYYGKSRPTINTSTENMQYLNVDQALADVAYFIETKKKEEKFQNSTVIVFGGSYAGNMATWARLKYPHLIQGALASSAPIRAKADFYEYYEVVTRSLARHSEKCVVEIKAAFDSVEQLLGSESGPAVLKKSFNLCDLPDRSSPSETGYLMNMLGEEFAGVVQYDKVVDGRTTIAACCSNMTAMHLGNPFQRLARFISKPEKCTESSYRKFVNNYRNTSWEAPAATGAMRQWFHQTCTEYGYYQTTNSKDSIFGTLFPLSYFVNICIDLYSDDYNEQFLQERVRRTNLMYGGSEPDLTNVIFTNGDIDPWHSLSVLKDLNEHSPSILINGSSHCQDLKSDAPTDVEGLTKARIRIRQIVGKWLES